MLRTLFTAAVLVAVTQTGAQAGSPPVPGSTSADDRLMIVNGNSGRVIYNDGRNDLFCVTRRVIVGYDADGDPIRRRRMHCR